MIDAVVLGPWCRAETTPPPAADHRTDAGRRVPGVAVSEVRITAEPRTEFGKGAARRIRRDNKVPAVLYGHGTDPRHISLPGHELMLALKNANVLLTLDARRRHRAGAAEGRPARPDQGLPRARRPGRGPPRREGHRRDPGARRRRRRAGHPRRRPTQNDAVGRGRGHRTSPTGVEVSVEGLQVGSQIHAKDVALPEGTTLVTDPDALVVNIVAAQTAEQVEAELAEAEAEVGIVHEAAEAEAPRPSRPPRAARPPTATRRASRPRAEALPFQPRA